MNPDDLLYTVSHEWVRRGNSVTIGITHFAQDQLGDVIFVELPKVGQQLVKDDVFGSVESVKTVSDLFAPVSGEVVEVNDALTDQPELINSDPYNAGWLIKVRACDPTQLEGLLDSATYAAQATH